MVTRDQLRAVLARYEAQDVADHDGLWPAGVLVLVHDHAGEPHIVFQKRTDRVDAHKGQVSFPGGGHDPGDTGSAFTALRETHEEIGVAPAHVEILGRLDQVRTISNFVVTPVVGWLDRFPYEWRLSHDEVAYLIEVPLAHLLDPATFVPDVRVIDGHEVVVPSYRFGGELIWGATGRMVANVLDLCRLVDLE